MEEEVTEMDARKQLLSLLERRTVPSQCRCTCLHNGGDSGSFKGWGAIQCSAACGLISRESLGSKSVSKECISGSMERQKSGNTKAAAGKRRGSSGDKIRVYPLMSRSVPSLSSQDLYNVRGTEVCCLQPHEQALYYRQKVTYDAARKGDVVHTHLPPRKKREAEPIAPQVATKGPGLQITPVHKPSQSDRYMELRGTASADSFLLLQTGSRATAAKQGTSGSNGSRSGAKKKLEQDSRVHWASMKLYRHNHSVVDGELSKDERSPKRSVLLQGRMKNQFTHHRLKMLQYQPELKAGRSGAGWLEREEVCSMPTLHDTTSGSETLLTNPLKCFPLGPSVTCKDQKEESSSKKPAYQQKEKKKNSKGKGPSRPVVPALGHTVHGVVYNSQQPANLLQHRCQVSFMGMRKGFRYETLCMQGYGRSSPPLMVVGPWITTTR